MQALVGGRLEAVAARPVTDLGDRARLLGLLLLAVAVHGWLLVHTRVTARDSVGLARMALVFENPAIAAKPEDANPERRTIIDALKDPLFQHPPGYPLAVLAVSKVVRRVYEPTPPVPDPLPDQMLVSAQVTSCLAAILLVFPTYWLGRTLFGKPAGLAAAVLFQVLPVPAHITSDGLTEALYLLGLAAALVFGVRAVRNPGVGPFLQCGLATGLTYLVRPEGLLAGVAAGAVLVGLAAARRVPRGVAAGRLTALAVGVMIPAAPYMAAIGGVSNKPAASGLIDKLIGNPRQEIQKAGAATGAALFAAWAPKLDGSQLLWAPVAVAKETGKAMHYLPLALAVIGLAAARRRVGAEPWVLVPVGFAGLQLGLLLALAGGNGYVSERHTLPVAFVGVLFAAGGLGVVARWLAARLPGVAVAPGFAFAGLLVLLVATALPGALKPLHPNREGHRFAGLYLHEKLLDGDALVDPFEWALFYSGRTLHRIPADPENPPVRWAVLGHPGDVPHSRLPRWELARSIAANRDATVAYQWPPDAPLEKAQVVVYRLEGDGK